MQWQRRNDAHHPCRRAGIAPSLTAILCLFLSACASNEQSAPADVSQNAPQQPVVSAPDPDLSYPRLNETVPADALETDSDAANYLVGQQALSDRDLLIAADYFTRTLAGDKTNPDLLQRSFLTLYQTGQIDEAAIIARQIEASNLSFPLSSEPAAGIAIVNEDWDAAQALSEQMLASGGNSNLAYLTSAWSEFAKGQKTAGLSQMIRFSRSLTGAQIPPFMYLHLSHLTELSDRADSTRSYLDLISEGRVESAEIILSTAAGYLRLGETEKAIELLETRLGSNFYIPKLNAQIAAGRSDLQRPMTLKRAIAQSILDEGWLNANQSGAGLLMPHAYLALRIDPELHAARFVLAQLFVAMEKYESATALLADVPDNSGWSLPSLFLQLNIYLETESFEQARTLLDKEIAAWPENRRLHHLMGDIYRRERRCDDALIAYDEAERRGDTSAALYRSRGVCYAEIERIELAERYLQEAINLNPNDASALNYLGYIWADEGRNLNQALSYIENAVRLRPDSGYYADSLGWVYYRMNRLEDSVLWLEKAFQLAPEDFVISEHLADAYWRVGRRHEARYKWQYALDLADKAEAEERITKKLALEAGMTLPDDVN